jgi:hypothetical protein
VERAHGVHPLQHAAWRLLEYEGATLLDVNRMLINKAFRKKVVDNVKDPIVKSFWVDEFANYTDRYTQDATPAIQNKVGQFTSNPLIRNIVGQPKSSFDIRQMMDEKKILIMNLSKGRVGEVNATLLGSMLVTKIYLAAMSRADVPASRLATLAQVLLLRRRVPKLCQPELCRHPLRGAQIQTQPHHCAPVRRADGGGGARRGVWQRGHHRGLSRGAV